MSDERLDRGPLTEGAPLKLDRERDENLSALVDGQLDPEQEARLRAEVASDLRLSRRLADFERVDAALRALPSAERSRQRLSRLRERVLAELPEGSVGVAPETTAAATSEPAPTRPRRSLRSLSGSARVAWAALAASLLAALVLGSLLGRKSSAPPERIGVELELELNDVAEEDIGVALELETLADYELVEDLELLELMEALSARERS